jgi:biotin carboxyl carrier protein
VPDQVQLETRVVEGNPAPTTAARTDAARTDAARTDAARTDAERAADHAAIAGSIDELLPALIAKLGATGLAELEVRESGLRVRLRRPAEATISHDRRATDRVRGDRARGQAGAVPSTHPVGMTPVGPGRETRDGRDGRPGGDGHDAARLDEPRAIATSPAVGIYQPRAEARAGTRVRAGDRLGMVDMLGVPQEVVAPMDGLVGASLVEAGEAVEYGQELVVIEFATAGSATGGGGSAAAAPASVVPPAPLDH